MKKIIGFLECFLWGILITWIVLTVGILIKLKFNFGKFSNIFADKFGAILNIYIFAGILCGVIAGLFIWLIKQRK